MLSNSREIESGNIAVRSRDKGELGEKTVEDFISEIKNEITNRLL